MARKAKKKNAATPINPFNELIDAACCAAKAGIIGSSGTPTRYHLSQLREYAARLRLMPTSVWLSMQALFHIQP